MTRLLEKLALDKVAEGDETGAREVLKVCVRLRWFYSMDCSATVPNMRSGVISQGGRGGEGVEAGAREVLRWVVGLLHIGYNSWCSNVSTFYLLPLFLSELKPSSDQL